MHWQDWQEHVVGAAFAAGLTAWAALVAEEVPAPYLVRTVCICHVQR
jgi:hypothetical protein